MPNGVNSVSPQPLMNCQRTRLGRGAKLLIGLAFMPAVVTAVLILLRLLGLIIPFSVPTEAMAPAVSAGDHVLMEGFTFWVRTPRRGDIVVFKTDGIASTLPRSMYFLMRIAGEPGEHLRILGGELYVNEKAVALSNALGEITYLLPQGAESFVPRTNVTLLDEEYFLLGDNSANSMDSRFWGCLPRRNIRGRVVACYWPLERAGGVK